MILNHTRLAAVAWLLAVCLGGTVTALGQQMFDQSFDAKVAKPAYVETHPRLLFDEAHFNVHTTQGGYKPFADLMTNDGYQVTPNDKPFDAKGLAGFDVLVIANARGAPRPSEKPAFTEAECEASQISAQRAGPRQQAMGMNYPGIDNRQFALNIMHWLCKLIQ